MRTPEAGGLASRRAKLAGAAIFTALVTLTASSAPAYELNPDFGGDGIVTTDGQGSSNDSAEDMVRLANGDLLVAGFMTTTAGSRDFALARYNDDGTLDGGFGGGDGIVTTDVSGNAGSDIAFALAVQGDGAIVLAGVSRPAGPTSDDETAIVRYEADGSLDDNADLDGGFGGDGIVLVDVTPDNDDEANAVVVDGSGRVTTAGSAYPADPTLESNFALVRLEADGDLDPTFDGPTGVGNGVVTIDITGPDGYDAALAIDLLDDGDVLAAGFGFPSGDGPAGYALVRLNGGDGTLDAEFDGDGGSGSGSGNGIVVTDTDSDIRDLAVSAGKVLAVGGASGPGWGLARYNQADGKLDSSFDGDGLVTTAFGPGVVNAGAADVVIDGSRYVVTGTLSASDGDQAIGVARYFGGGQLDTAFGGDGRVVVNRESPEGGEEASALAVVDDGNALTDNDVVVAGRTQPGAVFTTGDWLLLRLRPDVTAPLSTITKPDHRQTYRAAQIGTLKGLATDAGAGLGSVEIALRRRKVSGACAWWDGGSFSTGDCATRSFVDALGTETWSYELGAALKPSQGTNIKDYTVYSRATDLAENTESVFESGRNANRFEVR
ncbi:MAG: hypothetical protein ACR2G3_00950 [Solirubrobacterales bacterium]